MPPAWHPSQPFFPSRFDNNRRRLQSLVPSSRMNSSSRRRQTSAMPSLQSASPFWQLLAILAKEPDLRWLDWVLRQREAATRQARAEAAARPAEATAARSRSRPDVRATFLQEGPAAAAEEEAPPSGGAAGGQHRAGNDCRLCRSQASHHFGPRPLEALRSVMHSTHPRIWRIYKVGLSRFVAFREEAGLPSAWPIPREQIRGFLVTLDSQRLSSPNIIAYLAGLSFISRMFHFPDPLQDFLIPRLVTGLHRRGDIRTKGWTPLSLEMLWCLVEAVDSVCATVYDRILFRAVFLLAWFAALRPEEIVAEDNTSLDPALLRLNDFEFLEDSIRIQLRVLGVGPERFEFRLGRGKESVPCPILAVSKYLEARPRVQGPFFIHGNGEPLTKRQFLAVFDRTLTLVGLSPQHFSLNSFWVGAMITAVKCRLPEQLMLRLVRCPNRGNPQ